MTTRTAAANGVSAREEKQIAVLDSYLAEMTSIRKRMKLIALLLTLNATLAALAADRTPTAPAPGAAPSPAGAAGRGGGGFGGANTAASAQDRQKMMDLLHITSLRPGRNGGNPQATNYANYDESKANPFPSLPDPLVLKNGHKVTTTVAWWNQRRPEIVEDFDREIYGRVPANTPAVKWDVTSTTRTNNADVPVITKQLVGRVDNSSYPEISVTIQASLTTPANATGAVPVMICSSVSSVGLADLVERISSVEPIASRAPDSATRTVGCPGNNRFSPRAGAMPSSVPIAFKPTTARA